MKTIEVFVRLHGLLDLGRIQLEDTAQLLLHGPIRCLVSQHAWSVRSGPRQGGLPDQWQDQDRHA